MIISRNKFLLFLPFLIFLGILVPATPVFAQTEFPIEVTLEYEGSAPPGAEYTFRFRKDSDYDAKEDFIRYEGDETFTVRPGETISPGKIVLDTTGNFSESSYHYYTYSVYQIDQPELNKSGVFLDPSEKERTLYIRASSDPEQCQMELLEYMSENSHSFSVPEDDPEKLVFRNIYSDAESTDLKIKVYRITEWMEPISCKIWFFDENGLIKGEFPFSGDPEKGLIASGDEYAFSESGEYVVSGLPIGSRYAVWPEYQSTESCPGGIPYPNGLGISGASGTVPNVAILDAKSFCSTTEICSGAFYPEGQKAFESPDLNPEIYKVSWTCKGETSGDMENGETYIFGESSVVPLPVMRGFSYSTFSWSNEYQSSYQWSRAEWEVKIEPYFRNSQSSALEYSCVLCGGAESYPESGDGSCEISKTLLQSTKNLTGIKKVNEKVPEETYTFKAEPESASISVSASYVADGEKIFFELGRGNYSGLKFSYETPKELSEATDYSATEDGSVLGWREGDVLHISTGVPDRKVVFRNFSLRTNCFEYSGAVLTSLDVTALKPLGRLSFYKFKGTAITGLNELDVSEVTSMADLFYYCRQLSDISGIDRWDTSKVTTFSRAFSETDSLQSVSLPHWDVSAGGDFSECFSYSGATEIDLSFWKLKTGVDISCMFKGLENLRSIYAPTWDGVLGNTDSSYYDLGYHVFYDSSSLFGYSSSKTGAAYCKSIEEGGYFSAPRGNPTVDRNSVYVLPEDQATQTLPPEQMPLPETGKEIHNIEEFIDWGYIYFDNPGEYVYTVKEVNDRQAGVVYDNKTYTVTFTVSEDENSVDTWTHPLKVNIRISPDSAIAFNNTKVNGIPFEISVEKVFRNKPEAFTDCFTYKLEPDEITKLKEGYALPADSPVTVTAKPEEKISFGEILFSQPGSYTFVITEEDSGEEFVKYDASEWKATVKVETDEDGSPKIDNVTYNDSFDNGMEDDQPEPLEKPSRPPSQTSSEYAEFVNIYSEPEWMRQKVTFVNVYQKTVDYSPKIQKLVTSGIPAPAEIFTFCLEEDGDHQDGCIMPDNTKTTVTGSGSAVFSPVTFEKAGTYRFVIYEEPGIAAGYRFDRTRYTLEVTVNDNGSGLLSIESVNYT